MHEVLRTGEPKQISVSQVAWSPDGSEIAFVRIFYVGSSEADFRHELWIMGADGSDPHRLIDREIESFSWSSDGSRIAFTEQSVVGQRFQWDIHVMDADGSNVQPLTDDGRSRFPAWSPDGVRIAFQRWVEYDEQHLYVLEPNDPEADPRAIWTGGEAFDTIAWSPDSARIAIDTFDQREERCSLLTVTLDGDVATVLESQRPEPVTGGTGESSLCAGTLAWSALIEEAS
jgi:Tol biopolymer transport system component